MIEILWILFLITGTLAFTSISLCVFALIIIMIIEEIKILDDRKKIK